MEIIFSWSPTRPDASTYKLISKGCLTIIIIFLFHLFIYLFSYHTETSCLTKWFNEHTCYLQFVITAVCHYLRVCNKTKSYFRWSKMRNSNVHWPVRSLTRREAVFRFCLLSKCFVSIFLPVQTENKSPTFCCKSFTVFVLKRITPLWLSVRDKGRGHEVTAPL